ncbi:SRPBCC family protein [Kitasatospora camelliae]|uniref:SRPBCC family protein n=1 Tax=Kitasatospora camelliae TaxID=3156397 RepID=A0AAU8JUD5_9ACTN
MDRQWAVEESATVAVRPEVAYRAVAELRRMGEWSPECRAVWVRRGPAGVGTRFVGWNRKGWLLWFTTGRVTVADQGREFAFRVVTFGLPVAEWGYRFQPAGDGGSTVTEYWTDLRRGRGARLTEVLGRIFSGTRAEDRAAVNRAGMRTTLERLRHSLEGRSTEGRQAR